MPRVLTPSLPALPHDLAALTALVQAQQVQLATLTYRVRCATILANTALAFAFVLGLGALVLGLAAYAQVSTLTIIPLR